MASPSVAEHRHTLRPVHPVRTIFETLASLAQPVGVRPDPAPPAADGLLLSIKDAVAQAPAALMDIRVPVLYVAGVAGNQLWGDNGSSLYQDGAVHIPPNTEFVGTLVLSDTMGVVPARVYYHDEQKTVFAIVHEANLHQLEAELRKECQLPSVKCRSLMDYGPLKTKGAAVLPSFLRSATEPYHLVREGVAPILAMRAPETTKELVGGVLDKGSVATFVAKMKATPASKFITVFTKSCPPPPGGQGKLTAQEAKSVGDDLVHALVHAIVHCRLNNTNGVSHTHDMDSETDTTVMTPSPHRWAERPIRHLSVRAVRPTIQLARTLYGTRGVADKELGLLGNMLDVARAIFKELLSLSDALLLDRFLSLRFRNGAATVTRAEMLQAIAEALDGRCSLAFAALATGGGGELAPPLLLATGGGHAVVETTAEHLARLIDGGSTVVIKFSHMENRVRQVVAQGVARATLRLSEVFRTSMISSLIHDSHMQIVARPPVAETAGFTAPTPRAPQCAEMDAALLRLDAKRQRVQEQVARGEGVRSCRSQSPPGANE